MSDKSKAHSIDELQSIYDNVVIQILNNTPDEYIESVRDRFDNAIEVFKEENSFIYVIVKDALTKMLIEKFNSYQMNQILEAIVGKKMGFKFITQEDANKERESNTFVYVKPDEFDRSNRKLRPEFTFDNYVSGVSNRFAVRSCLQVAEAPLASFANPLFLFGGVGLGKTHLMMSIGHYILDNNINTNVVYTTTQQFIEDMFVYTKLNKQNIEQQFYDKYRSADVLLVDDIQFLETAKSTQEEFFKVFEFLHENNKQIVITSDRMVKELKLMPRLMSRFEWGMAVDIKKPDKELRINILKSKLKFLISNPSDVPDVCLDMIAEMFTENVRELEGALRRFITYCVSFNLDFTPTNVEASLEGIIPKENNDAKLLQDTRINKVKKVVANYFIISEDDLVSKSRKPLLVYARNLCYYIIRNKFDAPLTKIGQSFGNKDHTTITHGIENIKDALNNDPKTKSDIQNIENKLDE